MTTEEFEQWLRQQQAYCVRKSLKNGLSDEEIFVLLEKERLTEDWIQSILQRHTRIKRGEIRIPDWVLEELRKSTEDDDEVWEDA